jgi:hypothetical protein
VFFMLKALIAHQDIIVYIIDTSIAKMQRFLDNLLASIPALHGRDKDVNSYIGL